MKSLLYRITKNPSNLDDCIDKAIKQATPVPVSVNLRIAEELDGDDWAIPMYRPAARYTFHFEDGPKTVSSYYIAWVFCKEREHALNKSDQRHQKEIQKINKVGPVRYTDRTQFSYSNLFKSA